MEEIQALLERFESWTAACVKREVDMIAYTLAKEAKKLLVRLRIYMDLGTQKLKCNIILFQS
jgi:hypothetical protein